MVFERRFILIGSFCLLILATFFDENSEAFKFLSTTGATAFGGCLVLVNPDKKDD